MNENHYNINSERIGNILMHKELNFLNIEGEKILYQLRNGKIS